MLKIISYIIKTKNRIESICFLFFTIIVKDYTLSVMFLSYIALYENHDNFLSKLFSILILIFFLLSSFKKMKFYIFLIFFLIIREFLLKIKQ
jgi:hypothetical protein